MSSFLCKSLIFGRINVRNPIAYNPLSLRLLSSSVSRARPNEHSFAVSYLINSLGLSEKSALSISKHTKFKTSQRPDKAIEFLRNFGFAQTQILRIVRAFPSILIRNTERTILPKLEFFESKGISRPDLTKSLSLCPNVLGYSLKNRIIPTFEFLRNSLFGSDETTIVAFRRHPSILCDSSLKPNIGILRDHGVSLSHIAVLICRWPRTVLLNPHSFLAVVKEVELLGFDPLKANFVVAVSTFRSMSKSTRASKVGAVKKWGLSDQEVSEVFRRDPRFMCVSEDKISKHMEFFTSEMGWSPRTIAKYPVVLSLSLERTMRRCLVYKSLLSKGLLKKELSMTTLLICSNEKFLRRFVVSFEKEAPELLKLYRSNVV